MKTSEERKVIAWSCSADDEYLSSCEIDCAIEQYLDFNGTDEGEIEVYGFNHIPINVKYLNSVILDSAMDYLNEYHGHPDDDLVANKYDKIKEACKIFVQACIDNYELHSCEVVRTEKINVSEWIKKNRPEWIEKDGGEK